MNTGKICLVCGTEYPLTQLFCPNDGSPLRSLGASPSDLVGQIVADRYYVVRQLGEGGMGRVYLVEHVKMGRKIALKVLRPGVALDADSISRFNREATNASKITHPNVAQIYDFGETNDGLLFLAMEFVEGQPLSALIALGPVPPLRVADIVRQTSEALSAAHELGIVHRDLKPDNIMLARARDNRDLVKVVDFGIAKSSEGAGQTLTKTGSLIGTPDYMSPERLVGDRVDTRSDIYSLGLVAFKMLAHGLPFPGDSAQEAIVRRLTDRPKPLKEVCPDIPWPTELQQVIDRALERDPQRRYQTAVDFASDFTAAVESGQITQSTQLSSVEAGEPKRARHVEVLEGSVPGRRVAKTVSAPARMTYAVAAIAVLCTVGFAAWRTRADLHRDAQMVVQAQGEVAREGKAAGPAALIDSVALSRVTARTTSASQPPEPPKFKFPNVRLFVSVVGFPPDLGSQIDRMAARITGVTVIGGASISNASAVPDFFVRPDSGGGAILEQSAPRGTIVGRFDSASISKPLPDAIREQAALKILSVLDSKDASDGVTLDLGSALPVFLIGQPIRIRVHSEHAGYLTLVDVNPEGGTSILYPRPGIRRRTIGPADDVTFDQGEYSATGPAGRGVLRAIVTARPLALGSTESSLDAPDGPLLATQIDRAIQQMVDTGSARWATAWLAYKVK